MPPASGFYNPVKGVIFICLGLVPLAATMSAAAAANPSRPNVLVIVGDDMGYADVGTHGCQDIPTPHLDSLATSGVRCSNGYVSGPYCSPTRAGLLTGRYQTRFGHEFNPGPDGTGLPLTETTLADRFKAAGYATGIVGKWHLGNEPKFHPQKRGFEDFFGFLGGAHPYTPIEYPPILRGKKPVDEQEYLTDAFGREAVAWIDNHRDRPFFLYLAFNAVHTPMQANAERIQKFASIGDEKRRTYAAMMSAMDDNIGKVLTKLRDTGLDKNTLIFFISDNGGPTMRGTTINASSNKPLRGSKRTTLEGGIRVPFFVSWPGHLPAGKVYDKPVIQLDILPTALTAAGVQIAPEWKVEGVDLLPFFTSENSATPHDTLYWRMGKQMAIRQGDWKLVRYDPNVDSEKGEATPAKLYNLVNDISEQHDLSSEQPAKVAALQTAWGDWDAANVTPLWSGKQKKKAEVNN